MGLKGCHQRTNPSLKKTKFHKVYRDGICFRVLEGKKRLFVSGHHLNFNNIAVCPDFVILRDTKTKRLVSCPLDPENYQTKFLIKTYKCSRFFNKLTYLFRNSKGYREWKLACKIERKGIPTLVPFAIGEKRKFGLLQESLIVVEMLKNSIDLEELFLKEVKIDDFRLKREIICEYGRWASRIHNQGILQDDFDPNNVLLQWKDNQRFQLFLIDFARVKLFKSLSVKKKVHSLAKLNRMGSKMRQTDRLRFLKAYLEEDFNDRSDLREWLNLIEEDEKKVLQRDCRRAARRSVIQSNKIGHIKTGKYRGYYQKRSLGELKYSLKDVLKILNSLEKMIDIGIGKVMPGKVFELAINLEHGMEKFQVHCFQFSGLKYWLLRIFKKTPTLMAWKAAHILLKKKLATFIPIAAVERKATFGSYQGFLIKKPFPDTNMKAVEKEVNFLKILAQLKTLPYSKYFEEIYS